MDVFDLSIGLLSRPLVVNAQVHRMVYPAAQDSGGESADRRQRTMDSMEPFINVVVKTI